VALTGVSYQPHRADIIGAGESSDRTASPSLLG
jgi:hypothetical protein